MHAISCGGQLGLLVYMPTWSNGRSTHSVSDDHVVNCQVASVSDSMDCNAVELPDWLNLSVCRPMLSSARSALSVCMLITFHCQVVSNGISICQPLTISIAHNTLTNLSAVPSMTIECCTHCDPAVSGEIPGRDAMLLLYLHMIMALCACMLPLQHMAAIYITMQCCC